MIFNNVSSFFIAFNLSSDFEDDFEIDSEDEWSEEEEEEKGTVKIPKLDLINVNNNNTSASPLVKERSKDIEMNKEKDVMIVKEKEKSIAEKVKDIPRLDFSKVDKESGGKIIFYVLHIHSNII